MLCVLLVQLGRIKLILARYRGCLVSSFSRRVGWLVVFFVSQAGRGIVIQLSIYFHFLTQQQQTRVGACATTAAPITLLVLLGSKEVADYPTATPTVCREWMIWFHWLADWLTGWLVVIFLLAAHCVWLPECLKLIQQQIYTIQGLAAVELILATD